MAVFPINDSTLVNKLGQVLGVDLDVVISLNNLDGMPLNAPSTLTVQAFHRIKHAVSAALCHTKWWILCYLD